MTVLEDIQKLEVGGWIVLLSCDLTEFGGGVLYFHGYQNEGPIVWQGQEYSPWPLKMEGFEITSDTLPSPKVALGNVDGSITALCILFQDMIGAKVTIKRTCAKYLDAANFDGGNPDADPDEHLPDDVWYVERKIHEDPTAVVFELAGALNFAGVNLPRRPILANHCYWLLVGGYRGPNCGYSGGAVAKADDTPTSDLSLDRCGGRLSSCKLRFGATGKLPYGAFPAAGLVRT